MSVEVYPVTAEAFDAWILRPENSDRRVEFVAGKVVEVPSNPGVAHRGNPSHGSCARHPR